MANFLSKRLQVFVSSTYTDLIEERQAAVEAILTAGHIPAGMELFTAGDESQMVAIKQWIDESDVYMLILGGRYGSVDPKTGKSYTHLEYEYALHKGKPLFACVASDAALDKKVASQGRTVLEQDNSKEFKEFRALATSKLVRFWEDTKDIKIFTSESLAQIARRDDLVGWVRPSASQADMAGLANEIARLSHENATLRAQQLASSGPTIEGFSFGEMKEMVEAKKLLGFLIANKDKFLRLGGFVDTGGRSSELAALGLLEQLGNYEYRISPAGKQFIARIELQAHRESGVTPQQDSAKG